MSYKDQRQALGIAAPAGSVAPHNSTMDGSKWHHGVGAADLGRLTKIGSEINEVFDKGLRDHARMQINIGRLLNDARVLIPGDRQFGQWREANTPINNKSSANKLMNLARQVGEGRITQTMIDGLPLSSLKELLTAPESVLGEITERLEAGETPTRDEIRQTTREANGGSPDDTRESDDEPEDAPTPPVDAAPLREAPESPRQAAPAPQAKGPVSPASPPRVTQANEVPKILAMTLLERLRHLDPDRMPYDACKPEEWAWLVMGLDPVPAYNASPYVIEVLAADYQKAVEKSNTQNTDRLLYTIQKARDICAEVCES